MHTYRYVDPQICSCIILAPNLKNSDIIFLSHSYNIDYILAWSGGLVEKKLDEPVAGALLQGKSLFMGGPSSLK